jgi:hypothetical protein
MIFNCIAYLYRLLHLSDSEAELRPCTAEHNRIVLFNNISDYLISFNASAGMQSRDLRRAALEQIGAQSLRWWTRPKVDVVGSTIQSVWLTKARVPDEVSDFDSRHHECSCCASPSSGVNVVQAVCDPSRKSFPASLPTQTQLVSAISTPLCPASFDNLQL